MYILKNEAFEITEKNFRNNTSKNLINDSDFIKTLSRNLLRTANIKVFE